MRRTLIRGLLIIVAVSVMAPIAVAQANRTPVIITPFTLPSSNCGFPINVGVVTNNEYQDVTTLADGTIVTKITGKLVLSFTNAGTGQGAGETIVRNVSGPTTETDHFDTQGNFVGGTFVARGNNWFGFGPVSQANTGEPGLVFTSGLATLGLGSTGVTSFSLSGRQVNGCALLAG